MQIATINELKKALADKSEKELIEICLKLAKFKKENKELLNYLIFESKNEGEYVGRAKADVSGVMADTISSSFYHAKKTIRKALKITRQYIKFSDNKITEIDLMVHFCRELIECEHDVQSHPFLYGLLERQTNQIAKKLEKLHEDIQLDYQSDMEEFRLKSKPKPYVYRY